MSAVASEEPTIHPSATVSSEATIGKGSSVWHHCHVMANARIGERCVLGHAVFVAPHVVVGDGCRIQNHVSLFDGVILECDVFVGPSAVFTNVKNPRAFVNRKSEFRRTTVRRGATIGANATILPGVTLGQYCFIAAGAVVTHDVSDFSLVQGTPARHVGWVSRTGERLTLDSSGFATCPATGEVYRLDVTARVLSIANAVD